VIPSAIETGELTKIGKNGPVSLPTSIDPLESVRSLPDTKAAVINGAETSSFLRMKEK
jgi:hypothetical protein